MEENLKILSALASALWVFYPKFEAFDMDNISVVTFDNASVDMSNMRVVIEGNAIFN